MSLRPSNMRSWPSGVTDIVICGHSNCGAMKAIADNADLEPMPAVSHWLRYSDAAKAVVEKKTSG